MLNPRAPKNRRTLRFTLTFYALSVMAILATVFLPTRSGAKLQAPRPAVKRSRPPFVAGEALVRYRNEASAKAASLSARTLQVNGRAVAVKIERFGGSELVEGLRLARVPQMDTLAAIGALKQQPDVLYAEPNYILHADNTPNDTQFGNLYGMTKIGAPAAWDTNTGSASVVIGIVDEGIDINHPDLSQNIFTNPSPGAIPGFIGDLHGFNFVDNNGTIPPEDHATHVAGTAGARGNNNLGVVGVNWTVSLMSLRALDPAGGSLSDIIAAYNYARQMRNLFVSSGGAQGANVRVLNNSYGGSGFSQSAFDAISQLNQAGILFVGSAGNTDDGFLNNDINPHYPSDYLLPNVIGVAATQQSDLVSTVSHIGPNSVLIGAPGQSIVSTLPNNTYGSFSGTSMATPHVSGAAGLLLAQNSNLTVNQLKSLLIYNGDVAADLVGKTITGRRLNIANSFAALAENDLIAPGTVTNLHLNSQTGRSLNVGWTASGDNNTTGTASLYDVSFVDSKTGAVVPLKKVVPVASGNGQSVDVKIPYRHTTGTITIREFDNVGNEGIPATLNVSVSFADGDPYATTLGFSQALSAGGTGLNFNCDDCYKTQALPFNFNYFGQAYNTIKISSNGNIFFEPPTAPTRGNGEADDVPSSTVDLNRFRAISGMWDDLDLRTSQRAGADVYMVTPDANRVIFRWEGVPCNFNGSVCTGGAPINFEIELNSNGTIKSRYGSGNTSIFPVVGLSAGEPEAYVIPTHTSEVLSINLTNAQEVTYIPRTVINPVDNNFFFVTQQYRDFLGREPDAGGLGFWSSDINSCGTDPICLTRRRVGISAAFFVEAEFQRTGSFVVRSFRGGLGRRPTFAEFSADRPLIVEGPNLEQTKQAYMLAFVQRGEFTTKYAAATTATAFVDALIASINTNSGVDLTSIRTDMINAYNNGGGTVQGRANATRLAIDATAFQNAEFNPNFVLMQYFGYLQRDPEPAGFQFWLDVLNNRVPGNFQGMVCAFITSAEYQRRFSALTPHSDVECGPPAF
jgi:subtilisin family serine protease